jgi:hypothetical protein
MVPMKMIIMITAITMMMIMIMMTTLSFAATGPHTVSLIM